MKIRIAGYEVDIKVKDSYEDRASKESAMYLLNTISIWARESAEYNAQIGADALATEYEKRGQEIYDQLKAAGAYKKYEK